MILTIAVLSLVTLQRLGELFLARRNTAIPDPSFSGFYALATWSLTGEVHAYDPTTASFRGLRPLSGLGSGGFGMQVRGEALKAGELAVLMAIAMLGVSERDAGELLFERRP